MSKPFTKSDLKDGMRVELRSGNRCWLCGNFFVKQENGANWGAQIGLYDLNDSLNDVDEVTENDIIRVTDRDGTVLFEREPEKVKLELEVTPEQAEAIRKQLGQ